MFSNMAPNLQKKAGIPRAARPSLGHYYLCGPALLIGAWNATAEVRTSFTKDKCVPMYH